MGEVVNLRLARKRKARAEKAQAADENRARFGRSGAARERQQAMDEIDSRRHEGHRRSPGHAGPDGEAGA
jgi:hypothetical protein